MTLSQARSVFAHLMTKARGAGLSERDRLQLAQARQMLRRSKRPAMNSKKRRVAKSKANNRGRSPAIRRNPSGSMQRIGRAVEVRYRRDIGRQPGYYKHTIKSRKAGVFTIPPGWVYVSTRSILITEVKPRV